MRELEDAEVGFIEDCEDAVADVGNNADFFRRQLGEYRFDQ